MLRLASSVGARAGGGAAARRAAALATSSKAKASKPAAARAPATAAAAAGGDRDPVFVDGVRTPFQLSGTGYNDVMAWELAQSAISSLLARNPALEPAALDRVIMGTVLQEVRTSNVAREAAMAANVPLSVPAHTVTMACISANQALTSGVELIRTGQASAVLAGGVETMSDVPIRYQRALRKRMLAATRLRRAGAGAYVKLLKGLKLKDFAPEAPPIAEFSTGEVMGHSADRLASRWGVGRTEQDEYAVRSHTLAAQASEAGLLSDRVSVCIPTEITADNGIKADSSMDKLAKLKPAFVKPHGSVTAASSSFLTDGASAALAMAKGAAVAAGLKPKAYLRDYVYVGCDPKEELLLGPAYAIRSLLARNNMSIGDVDVWELHEAFAGQVLANLNALESEEFGRVGRVPMDKLNTWGGSLSLGHPFGATGTRLVSTAANRLQHEDGEVAVVAACAAGGLGTAMLVERYR